MLVYFWIFIFNDEVFFEEVFFVVVLVDVVCIFVDLLLCLGNKKSFVVVGFVELVIIYYIKGFLWLFVKEIKVIKEIVCGGVRWYGCKIKMVLFLMELLFIILF